MLAVWSSGLISGSNWFVLGFYFFVFFVLQLSSFFCGWFFSGLVLVCLCLLVFWLRGLFCWGFGFVEWLFVSMVLG